jgi:hypothetical protein
MALAVVAVESPDLCLSPKLTVDNQFCVRFGGYRFVNRAEVVTGMNAKMIGAVALATATLIGAASSPAVAQTLSKTVELSGFGPDWVTQFAFIPARPIVVGALLSYQSAVSATALGVCLPTASSCAGTGLFEQAVWATVSGPNVTMSGPNQTLPVDNSVSMSLRGDASTFATISSNINRMPLVFSSMGPTTVDVTTEEAVQSTGDVTVGPAFFAGSATITIKLLSGVTARPKPTPAQKALADAQIAYDAYLIGAIETDETLKETENKKFIEFLEDVLEKDILSLSIVVQDPDDPNYMVLETPGTPDVLTVPDIPGMTGPQLSTWDDLVNNLALSGPLTQAMTDSLNRAQGAYDAGDDFWAAAQFATFNDYWQQNLSYAAAVNADAVTLGLVSGSSVTGVPSPQLGPCCSSALLASPMRVTAAPLRIASRGTEAQQWRMARTRIIAPPPIAGLRRCSSRRGSAAS